MDAIFSSANSAETSTYQWFCLISVLLSLATTALISVSRWHIFKKLGLPGWKGIIPVYGDYTLFKNRWKVKPFWALTISTIVYYGGMILTGFVMSNNLSAVSTFSTIEEIKSFFIPYIVIYGLSALAYAIISLVITIALNYRLAESFGDGIGIALGLTILPAVFYPILAFAKKQETRRKRPLQIVSTVLTLALVFSILTCAPFSAGAAETDELADTGASYDELAETSADSDAPFGELSEGKYTLTSTTYGLSADFAAEGYIYVPSGVTATIDLNGFTIDRGLSNAGTDDYADFIVNDGNLTITDSSGDDSGMITGGYAYKGGAVVNNGYLTIEGGTFINNRSNQFAGAVWNNEGATLNVTGGVFKANSDGSGGGGAIVNHGTMTMSGGTITGNIAHPNGGGIWTGGSAATLNMTGGTVTGNYATGSGSGVYARADGTLNMSGSPVIINNAGSNLYLNGDEVINILVAVVGARVDISADNINRPLTNGLDNSNVGQFSFADGFVSAKEQNGELYPRLSANTTVSTWSELKNAVKTNNNTIALSADITNSDQDTNIEVSGKTLTIDLRGHKIDMNRKTKNMADNGHFMFVTSSSNVTFIDSYGGGYITGGNGTNGGVFDVSESATLTLYNITLKDNIGKYGGAIRSRANLNLNGTAIYDNTAEEGGAVYVNVNNNFEADGSAFIENEATTGSGGAVYSSGDVGLEDCLISGNTASQRGGALYNGNNASDAGIGDCVIKNNTANYGGAFYINTATVYLSDSVVSGNKSNNSGGAVFSDSNAEYSLNANSTLFKGNTARTNGGAINALTNIWLSDCTITGNTATYSGRGICIYGTMDISDKNVIYGNGTDNVYLATNSSDTSKKGTINRRISLSDQTKIGIKADDYDRYLVTGLANKNEGDYFVLDDTNTTDYELIKTCGKVGSSYLVYVKKTVKVSVNSWQGLQDAINDGDYAKIITLSDNITANSDQTRIRIYDDDTITLDLNGKTLSRARESSDKDGHVIEVHGGGKLTVRDSSSGKTGKITGGWAEHGGGINVNKNGELTLQSGTITGNKSSSGGGVYVHDNGAFTMSGGTIDSNTATQDGGGIFADYPVTVTGGTISNNSAKYGGGYYFDEPDMTAELSGVTISGNTASEKGGGIYVWHGTVTLGEGGVVNKNTAKYGGGVCITDKCAFAAENAIFTKNKATTNGGAIYNEKTLTLTSCTFTENEAEKNGGGVYNHDNAEIISCTFKKNKTVNGTGGAINQYDGSLLIDGGEITENMAAYRGSGVYIHEESDNEKFQIKGDINITGNVQTDLFLDGDEVVKIAGALSDDARVRVTMERVSGTFTKGYNAVHSGVDPATYFTGDDGFAILADTNGEAMIIESDWTLLKNEIEGAADNATITLDREWKAIDKDKTIVIPEGKHITLDLNGHTIDAKKAIGTVLKNNGTLVLQDSAQGSENSGKITGGSASAIENYGTMELKSGTITGSSADNKGGGIDNIGALTVSGGTITGNTSGKWGGGIYNRSSGTLTITGGTITGNTADLYGGGIYNVGVMTVSGGSITENIAVREGGGIYLPTDNSAVLNIKDEPIIEKNQSPIGNNILLCAGKKITITDSLASTAKLDVVVKDTESAITSGYTSHGSPAVFTYNGKTGLTEEKNNELYLRLVSDGTPISSWDELQTAINNASAGQVLVLKADLDGTNKNRLDVNGKTVTIELNGHTIDRKRTSSSDSGQVFYVHDVAKLTISDVAGTGTITGGNVSGDGGGILIDSGAVCTITGGSVQGNKSGSDGGGICVKGTLEMSGGAVAFNTASDTAGGIYCTESGTIKIDNALITGNKANDDDGGGLNLHLANDDSYIKNSYITNNYSDNNGGGFRLDAKGKTLTIENTEIKGNTSQNDGGGIYITEGTVNISGSNVNYNTGDNGGAVYFESGTKLIASGTHFEYNTATKHGAGAINCRSDMTMTDCYVNHNTCKQDGGGIYFDCKDKTITITNTEIDYNEAGGVGGGIGVENGTIEVKYGSISYNDSKSNGPGVHLDGQYFSTFKTKIDNNFTQKKNGGGIYLQTGEAHVKGGSISGNFAKYSGGGIYITNNTRMYIEEAVETVNGVETKEATVFKHNNCDQHGGAIYLEDDGTLHINGITVTETVNGNDSIFADEDFYIQGKIIVNNNSGSGIYMADESDKLHLEGKLDQNSDIDITLAYKTGSFTEGYKANHNGADPTKFFHADENYSVALDSEGEVRVRSTDWVSLQKLIDEAADGSTIQLTKSYLADEADMPLSIPSGKTLTLDLNGFTLDGGKAIGTVIRNYGRLTVTDTTSTAIGTITGGSSGAIFNDGEMNFIGGHIVGNAGTNSGGIGNKGTMTMTGGEISGNTAINGGGIYNTGTLYLYGGVIKNNESSSSGGGIYCVENSMLYVHGAPYVKENNAVTGKNILLNKNTVITIDGTLDSEAKLDVATKDYKKAITSGYSDHGKPGAVFSYNESSSITLEERPDGELYFPNVNAATSVGTWAELQAAVNNDAYQGKVIALENDLGAAGQQRIVVDNKNVTIDLAGYTMSRALGKKTDQGNVFKVTGSNAQLTIKDSVETGMISGGYADGDGGAFYVVDGAKLTVTGGSVQGNKASNDGAGIYVDKAELVMTGGYVANNYAGDNGGGIYTTNQSKLTLTNATISHNTSHNAGGGLNIHLKEDASFTDCVISDNRSETSDGGGIVMNASGKTLTLNTTTVKNNTSNDEGGGIYIDGGTVEMKGGSITGNTASDGGGVYVSGSDTFKATDEAVISYNQTTKQSGGGITCKGHLELDNATVSYNHSAKHGGGIYYQHHDHPITLTNAKIESNLADKDGGGIYLEAGTITLDGGLLKGNTSIDGGGIFVTDDTTFVAQNHAEISYNKVTEQDGGGIVNKGDTTLTDVTVSHNEAKLNGGGIWNNDTLHISGTTIENNEAKRNTGGGICHVDGHVYFTGTNTVTANTSGSFGTGIFVAEEANDISIQDKLTVADNNGDNIYLDEEVLTLSGALDDEARIFVCIEDDFGKFTKDYSKYHSGVEPSKFFVSDYFFDVYLDGGEAALKDIVDEENPFIPKNEQIRDSNKVTGRNWMSAVSGERRINEINLIRAHDASMNDVSSNMSSSIVRKILLPVGGTILAAGLAVMLFSTGMVYAAFAGWMIFGGGLITGLMVAFQEISSACAKTQFRYVDEQMNMGVRVFDLRINNLNHSEFTKAEDNKNLWHCHGENNMAGTFYGCDHDGDPMNANQTLEWAKEFLKKNPTEVILFEYDPETQDDSKYGELCFLRLKKILKEFSYEVNPSTGKPYLYLEDGVFKDYTYWPKLKDVRGQVMFRISGNMPEVGGYKWDMQGTTPNYTRYVGSNDSVNTPEERINQTISAFDTHPTPYILKDAMVHRNINSGLYVNTTDDSMAFIKGRLPKTPTDLAEKVYYGTGDVKGLLEEGGHYNQTGQYYGILSGDALTEKECNMLWRSNFSNDLEYRYITVKSGVEGDDEVKTYKVLKGTAITIPQNIYDYSKENTYFQCWRAKTGSNGSWDPDYSLQDDEYFGSDNEHGSNRQWLLEHSELEPIDPATQIAPDTTKEVMPGETITVMDNIEFTAVWGSDIKTPVTVVWNDGNDGDGLRTDRLEITYQNAGLTDINTAYADADEQWSAMISGDTVINSIKVVWNQVNVTNEAPRGSELNGYKYEVTGEVGKGFTITLTHKPQTTVVTSGVVSWDDSDNNRDVRPDSVTLKLLKNGEEIATADASASGGWRYTLGEGAYPAYSEVTENGVTTYQRDVYSVVEEPFMYYSATYNDFNITNVYVDPEISDVDVEINWRDGSNSKGERPKTVTLHLWDGDTEIDKKVVQVDPDTATTLAYFEVEDYVMKNPTKDDIEFTVTQDAIPNYSVKSNEKDGNTISIVNEYDKLSDYFQGHSLSLNGDIGVNFYIKLTPEEFAQNAKVHFEWFNKSLDVNITADMLDNDTGFYKVSCPVAVAEMTYDVYATLTMGGNEVETDKYSVVKYANVILSDKTFHDNYIAELKNKYGEQYDADGKYVQLVTLVLTMLDYGAKAQLVFDRNTDNLANLGYDFFSEEVTSDMIETKSSNMTENLDQFGLAYQYSDLVLGSATSLRHYYKITDETAFNSIKNTVTFDGHKVYPITSGDMVFFERQGISANQLDTQYVLKIGESEYAYSVMDHVKELLDSDVDEKYIEIGNALYRFNQAADEYSDTVVPAAAIASDEYLLEHQSPICITQQPADASAALGETVRTELVAKGEGLKYQWYLKDPGASGFSKSGLKSTYYSVAMVKSKIGRQVYCVITDAYGNTAMTRVATLNVEYPAGYTEPIITQQPVSATAGPGEIATVTLTAEGTELSYQWYIKNKGSSTWSKSSITTDTYSVEMTKARDGRELKCVVSDIFGNSVISDVVTIGYNYPDDYAIPAIVTQPKSATAEPGETATVKVTAVGTDLRYQWYIKNKDSSTWSKSSITTDTYSVTLTKARDGRELKCVITDKFGNSVTSDIVTIGYNYPEGYTGPTITAQPTDASAQPGKTATVKVTATGTDLKYQWYIKNKGSSTWAKSSITTDTYSVAMTKARDGRELKCVITDKFGNSVTSETALISIG